VCAVHYPDMAVKCKNLYTELCNEVYDHALVSLIPLPLHLSTLQTPQP
jgi:hypothetical protein